jgi:arginyl-tRNA synthetase
METLTQVLNEVMAAAFERAGYDRTFGTVAVSDRPDLAQYQCNGALPAAKAHREKPRDIAGKVVDALMGSAVPLPLSEVSIAGPGFVNLKLDDAFLAQHVAKAAMDERLGCPAVAEPIKVVIDYGGPNVAKPMHVGHLRSTIIGDSIKRITRFLGYRAVGDVHLGDWGLQMGMLIAELRRRQPELPYFEPSRTADFPSVSPVGIADLQEMYPAASARAKSDPAAMEEARQATKELQDGRPGFRALWRHLVNESVAELRGDLGRLGVEFELWLGESDTQAAIAPLVQHLKAAGHAHESEGALVIDVTEEGDKEEIPPLILTKSDGAALYGTTDLATIEQRIADGARIILYVVDNRQGGHFRQVFRAARKTEIAPANIALEHIGFGTMNGKDGKPFKTREGGVMRLSDLIDMVTSKARERMAEADVGRDSPDAEKDAVAHAVGMAALKYADLVNHRTKDYVFDLDRFSAFEGRTGPYLLYAAVRIKSILRKAEERGYAAGDLVRPTSDAERAVFLEIAKLPDAVHAAFDARAPNHLADYAYQLATLFNRFYKDHHILREENVAQRSSWLSLVSVTARVLELVLDLLGIRVPERM